MDCEFAPALVPRLLIWLGVALLFVVVPVVLFLFMFVPVVCRSVVAC